MEPIENRKMESSDSSDPHAYSLEKQLLHLLVLQGLNSCGTASEIPGIIRPKLT